MISRLVGSDSLGIAEAVGHIGLASMLRIGQGPDLERLALRAEGREIQGPGDRLQGRR